MSDTEPNVIECGSALGIADVGDLYAQLLGELAEGRAVQLDVSNVERVDAAAMQMIVAFSKEAAKQGHDLSWEGASEAFIRGAKILGLAERLNMNDNAH